MSASASSGAAAPSTHAEAEAALEANSLLQTDAAGPISSRPAIPHRTSSNNYIDASLASGAAIAPFSPQRDDVASATAAAGSAAAASTESWRPRFDRQQSFKREDLRRLMQEGLVAPVDGPGYESTQAKPAAADGN